MRYLVCEGGHFFEEVSMKKKEPKEKKAGYGQMLKVFLRSVREYKKDSILAALFITFETVFECVIPFVMSMLLTFMEKSEGYILNQTMTEGEAMATVGYYSLGLIALAFCSFGCGYTAPRSQQRLLLDLLQIFVRICSRQYQSFPLLISISSRHLVS